MIDLRVVNGINGVVTLLLFLVGGAVLLGHARKLSHDVLVQTARDWQELASSRLAIIEGLQQQLDAIQMQVTQHAERIATMERDNRELQRLNQHLQVRVEQLVAENERLQALVQRKERARPRAAAPSPEEACSGPREPRQADRGPGGKDDTGGMAGADPDPG